jgi:hypothetical protein
VSEGESSVTITHDDYVSFLASKFKDVPPSGFDCEPRVIGLFPHQRDLVRWAIARGRAAIFADTGLGKSRTQVEWARLVHEHAGVDVLILAPLAVAAQTVAEGRALGVHVTHCRDAADVRAGVNITNYDRLHRFDTTRFGAVVLDESSCIKHFNSKLLATLITSFEHANYRLACTATPAPNDYAELGTHAEFLGVCSRPEMLAEFFVHDSGDTQEWRLKGHARTEFWRWVASWAALVRRPSDLGYDDAGYALPELRVIHHEIEVTPEDAASVGVPFIEMASTLTERRQARKASATKRVLAAAALTELEPEEQWLLWGDLNAETGPVAGLIDGAEEVRGPDDPEDKERRLLAFADGGLRVLVSKPSIAGWGMNFQRCARMAFVGVSDSFEAYYQAVRRCWRFGQKRPVEVHIFSSRAEGAVVQNLERKEADARAMAEELSAQTREAVRRNVRERVRRHNVYEPQTSMTLPRWMAR